MGVQKGQEIFWSCLGVKLSGPLDLKGMHPFVEIDIEMEGIKKNYRASEDIEEELKNVDLENFLDFNYEGRYDFTRCEGCDGPLLGHMEVKCQGKEGQRYRSEILKGFENWLKRVPGFREVVKARRVKREEKKIGQIAEAVKRVAEMVEKKNRPEAKTT